MQRIYGAKKGEVFLKFPKSAGKSILKIKVEYYVDREVIKTIEGKQLVWEKEGQWKFQTKKHDMTLRQGKKGTLKLYKDKDSKGARIGGVFSIRTLRPKPKKIIKETHRWDFEVERASRKYYYVHTDDLTTKDMAYDIPTLVIL